VIWTAEAMIDVDPVFVQNGGNVRRYRHDDVTERDSIGLPIAIAEPVQSRYRRPAGTMNVLLRL
jgi:hypothetical protein